MGEDKIKIIRKNPRMKIIDRKESLIIKRTKGKVVLDVGCIDHAAEQEKGDEWIHRLIVKNAKSVLGLDYLAKDVKRLQKKGYNIIEGNAETFNLNEKFEVIFAGELIEHLSNPGLFLERCKKHLSKDGIVILTTPNTFSFRHIVHGLFRGAVPTNWEHTLFQSPITMKRLAENNGLKFVEGYYFINYVKKDFKYYIEKAAIWLNKSLAPNTAYLLKNE